MYKLKNNIVRVDASSKLIPNERPSRNNNEQALRIPSNVGDETLIGGFNIDQRESVVGQSDQHTEHI
jgi:hypothetical protein